MRLWIILVASVAFTVLSTVGMLRGFGITPTASEPSAPLPPTDPYETTHAAFIEGIKETEKISRRFGRFEWSMHGPLTVAHWGSGRPLRVMVVGQLHAREMFSAELVRLWMLSMITAKANDTGLVEWLMVPTANPCARDLVAEGMSALRNSPGLNTTKDWQVCKRTSCSGVDLNRNWATEYGAMQAPDDGRVHWDRSPETNPGNEAFSEPESASLRLVLHDFAPHILFNVHTGTVGVKTPPEDGSSQKPGNIPNLLYLKAWLEIKSNCCTGRPKITSKISQGSMTDYAARRIMTRAPFTLEVYARDSPGSPPVVYERSPRAYLGVERWGDNPMNCFSFFNPPSNRIVSESVPWLRIWRALFYLSGKDREIIESNLLE